jgi:hypothetical protein
MNCFKAIPKHVLSKSTFMRGSQCNKSLWLHKYSPELRENIQEKKATIFLQGANVGQLARELFPGGIDASPEGHFYYQQSVVDTEKYIAEGHKIIYEAAFQYDGVLCAIDLLVQENGYWYAYEVKSSTSLKPAFVKDAALQYHVITHSGIALKDIFLVHINNQYILQGTLNIKQLFNVVSIKKEVEKQQPFIIEKVKELKAVSLQTTMPVTSIGDHCFKPYDCDFYNHCSKDIILKKAEKDKEQILKIELRSFVQGLSYPLYFMDFETYMIAVPEYDGHWPYRQVPFQFSIHRQLSDGSQLEHHHYLAESDDDPCPQFVERLIASLGTKGSIIVYNKTFENARLNELKDDFLEYASGITAIQKRMVDLMTPFRKRFYYLPTMQNSYSLKLVLPALVPELSYDDMVISNGSDASEAFYNLRFENDESKIKNTRKALLDYCGLDTLAMVKLLEKLKSIV